MGARTVDVAVFGGSFNPPHIAHLLACTVVLATDEVDRLVVVPTYRHPFAKALAPYEDRVAMCHLAMGWLPRVEVSRIEEEPRWVGFDAIEKLAPPIVLGRAGFDVPGASLVLPEVSSTQVRAAIERGDWDSIASLVPRAVLEYARTHELYKRG
jgi:nicotinate-nucleotide adenylyltransferase